MSEHCPDHDSGEHCIALQEAHARIERMKNALWGIVSMVRECPDAPRNPDSLPQMILRTAQNGLSNRSLTSVSPIVPSARDARQADG